MAMQFAIRRSRPKPVPALVSAMVLGFAASVLPVMARAQAAPSQQDANPFPPDAAKAAQTVKPPQTAAEGQQQKPPQSSKEGDNPFPGEDAGVPIIPVAPAASAAPGGASARAAEQEPAVRSTPDPDADPVRSPDGLANTVDDGFSSSRSGLSAIPAEDDSDARPGKSVKVKTREQVIRENLDVGGFYLSVKNWKAAQARFTSAYELDRENPDAVFGLAEAERRLDLNKEAAEHFRLFLSYDPDGPHSKEARKALAEAEAALRSANPLREAAGQSAVPPQ